MNLISPRVLKGLFDKYNFSPRRQRGQNFLIDRNILDFIVQAAGLDKNDWVVEVGPGAGTLTQELAGQVKGVLALEIDPILTKILVQIIGQFKNVKVFKGDILSKECSQEIANWKKNNKIKSFKIVANIPYQITSKFLRDYLSREDVAVMILMVQKEVAKRIMARPGETSLLSLSVQFYSAPEILKTVSKNSFWPKPKVDSAIIKLDPSKSFKKIKKIEAPTERAMFQLMRMGFAARRKQLKNNLAAGLKIEKEKVVDIFKVAGLDEKARAQELSLEDWQKLAESVGFNILRRINI